MEEVKAAFVLALLSNLLVWVYCKWLALAVLRSVQPFVLYRHCMTLSVFDAGFFDRYIGVEHIPDSKIGGR